MTYNRKSAPRVKSGTTQFKNNRRRSLGYYDAPLSPGEVFIDRKRPGKGYTHVLTIADVRRFLALLPDWNEIAIGLNAVVLAPGEEGLDGWHTNGVVHICAWQAELWRESEKQYYEPHSELWERLGIECEPQTNSKFLCKWSEETVRAYQLLHILLHELGHHHDRMTTRYQTHGARGERYAEEYALRYEALIWERYWNDFPPDALRTA